MRRPTATTPGTSSRSCSATVPRRLDSPSDVPGSARSVTVAVPSWRAGLDVSRPEDLVEEVGRILGYDKLTPVPLSGRLEPVPEEPGRVLRRRVRQALSQECGFSEIYAYPFTTAEECAKAAIEPGRLKLSNAQQPGLDLLVTSLLPKVLSACRQPFTTLRELLFHLENVSFEDSMLTLETGHRLFDLL